MRFSFKLLLAIVLTFTQVACFHMMHNPVAEGIVAFRAEDYRTAFLVLKPEAVRGRPDAQYAVGYMYYYGKGVVENRKRAWYWINKAANQGQADAIAARTILLQQPVLECVENC